MGLAFTSFFLHGNGLHTPNNVLHPFQRYKMNTNKFILCGVFGWLIGLIHGLTSLNVFNHPRLFSLLVGLISFYGSTAILIAYIVLIEEKNV